MAQHLKQGKPQADRAEDDAHVRAVVESTLADIEARGDAAVRALSAKYDAYAPESFRLSPSEIEALMRRVSARDMEDIQFAQAQVRNFAQAQRESMPRHRGRDHSRRHPRPSQHPGAVGGLLRARRQVPDGRLGAYVGRHRLRRRRAAHHRLHPAVQRRAQPGGDRGDAPRRRARDLRARRHPGDRRHGARHRDHLRRGHAGGPRQRLRGRGQAPALRPCRHRPLRRPDRDHGHRRRHRRRRTRAPPTFWGRPSTATTPRRFSSPTRASSPRTRCAKWSAFLASCPPPTPRASPGRTTAK